MVRLNKISPFYSTQYLLTASPTFACCRQCVPSHQTNFGCNALSGAAISNYRLVGHLDYWYSQSITYKFHIHIDIGRHSSDGMIEVPKEMLNPRLRDLRYRYPIYYISMREKQTAVMVSWDGGMPGIQNANVSQTIHIQYVLKSCTCLCPRQPPL